MRNGYILLHRKGITPEDWKHPRRTLAWFDLLTLTNYETGVVTASYGFLAGRWRVSKHTAFDWMQHFVGERQLERNGERDGERNGERWFVVNYAKYQDSGERGRERKGERGRERKGELKKEVIGTKLEEPSQKNVARPRRGNLLVTADDQENALKLAECQIKNNPAFACKFQGSKELEGKVGQWAEDFEKLRRLDKATHEQIRFVLGWLTKSESENARFWVPNIQSGRKFRDKYTTMVGQIKREHQKKGTTIIA